MNDHQRRAARAASILARHRRTSTAFVAAAGCLIIAACGSSGTSGASGAQSPGGPAVSGTLSIGDTVAPPTLDPAHSDSSNVDEIDRAVYDTLVQFSNGPGPKLQPDLATSWTVSPDGLTYTFRLRQGVTFHNGAKVTAQDVKYSIDRIKSGGAGIYTELSAFASSKVLSPGKVVITLSSPYRTFLDALSRVYILNRALVQANAGTNQGQTWLATHEAGSGPYQLTQFVPNESVSVGYFKKYWGGWSGKHAANVTWHYYTNGSSEVQALQSGTVNFAEGLPSDAYQTFASRSGYTLNVAETGVQLYVAFNTVFGPTKNVLVRQAISYAFNYQAFIKAAFGGYAAVAHGPMPPNFPCYDSGTPASTYDLAKAKQLIKQAHATGQTVSIEYLPFLSEEKLGYELLASSLHSIGLKTKPLGIAFPAYINLLKHASTTPALGFVYEYPTFLDPNEVLYEYYDSKFIGTGYNWFYYSNSSVDKQLTHAQQETQVQSACGEYQQAQRAIGSDYPGINVAVLKWVTVLGPGVKGFSYNLAHHYTVNVYNMSV
ncbi:MAG TPA: ABC transporter substrate-binding protein [Streptosporangiaceae bacterium]|jgi:peptide/nickel transport system substrate-binding protein